MRDPNRIDGMVDKLATLWERCPDLRLGQLIMIIVAQAERFKSIPNPDIFNIEDDEMEKLMDIVLYKDRESQINRITDKFERVWLLMDLEFDGVIEKINQIRPDFPLYEYEDNKVEKALDKLLEELDGKDSDCIDRR